MGNIVALLVKTGEGSNPLHRVWPFMQKASPGTRKATVMKAVRDSVQQQTSVSFGLFSDLYEWEDMSLFMAYDY